ncbi:MAG: Response regulator receiver domain protein [Actinobacteria bacterium ADurb.Bin444]|nr:MAG: Response regulator receiver domain protein [Actinobacteria bacterium ADurb.Bin444]
MAEASSYRILVVDDHLSDAMVTAAPLQQRGHHVEFACDLGDAARKLAGGERWDLLISDIMMPFGGNARAYVSDIARSCPEPGGEHAGLGLLKWLRNTQGRNRNIPVILLSVRSDDQATSFACEHKAVLLSKFPDDDELLRHVRGCIAPERDPDEPPVYDVTSRSSLPPGGIEAGRVSRGGAAKPRHKRR